MATKNDYIGIKVSEVEKQILKRKAKNLNMSLSDLLLTAAHSFELERETNVQTKNK